jgi:hypothetical protein
MNGLYNPDVEPKPDGIKLVRSNVPRYWRTNGPSHNQAFYTFGSRTNIKHNFSKEDMSQQGDTKSRASSRMSYAKCTRLNLKYRDLKKQVQSKPREQSFMNEPYDPAPKTKMNDYTKNISQDIFNHGDKKSETLSAYS